MRVSVLWEAAAGRRANLPRHYQLLVGNGDVTRIIEDAKSLRCTWGPVGAALFNLPMTSNNPMLLLLPHVSMFFFFLPLYFWGLTNDWNSFVWPIASKTVTVDCQLWSRGARNLGVSYRFLFGGGQSTNDTHTQTKNKSRTSIRNRIVIELNSGNENKALRDLIWFPPFKKTKPKPQTLKWDQRRVPITPSMSVYRKKKGRQQKQTIELPCCCCCQTKGEDIG